MKWTVEAVYNIVDNVVKHTNENGSIIIEVKDYEMFCRIDIEDNGIGIAEEEQNKIFSRFYRSQQVQNIEGIGIGLFLTRKILSAQGGYMKVASKVGTGSTFSVFLPKEIFQNC
ncbi:sensor histidine kinase [Clostridium culturomicium]|uniref:sensor histidine kinase n=1 Tax=Clostridium culturomicium TaxID=1499683 RepID=UPI0038579ABE